MSFDIGITHGTARYTEFQFVYPSRPDEKVGPEDLAFFQGMGWYSQFKLNGTCNVVHVSPSKHITCTTRHARDSKHKNWIPTDETMAQFKALPGDGWWVILTELIHSKVVGMRNINYIRDILVADGHHLTGSKMMERQHLLKRLFLKGGETGPKTHRVIDQHTWLARNYETGHAALFAGAVAAAEPHVEGLVLNDPQATLALPFRATANSRWLRKCRLISKHSDC
jgi:hypothetical protein